jgi:pyruvate/2-oxoglutarate dehydrogenase complex dihydrolipoamide acyltransferase (E2) component
LIDVQIPKLGMSAVEVDILKVLVSAGAMVAPGQPLVEVESEKVSFMIESEWHGLVREVKVAAGDIANVGDVVVVIDEQH